MFAGIGGFRQALDELGGNCVFASEIDKYAAQSYKAIYGDSGELHGDITKIAAADIPDHDVLVGGFPCQAFSVAGQRKGFEDTRGTLFFEIARIAAEKKPRLLLLENVKGLLSHDGGNTFEVMCRTLNEIGYAIDFRVLNSKYFGVPQNRERIFIVADRNAAYEPWTDVKGNDVVTKAKRNAIAFGVRSFNFDWPAEGEECINVGVLIGDDYKLCDETVVKSVNESKYVSRKFHVADEISPTLRARDWKDGGIFFIHKGLHVRTRPVVHWRLQGFPDAAFDSAKSAGVSDSQLYKQAGNAVTVNVIAAIGKPLITRLQAESARKEALLS